MDPDETLKRLRELADKAHGRRRPVVDTDNYEEMGTLFEALDEWLSKGGFLPAAWRQDTPQTTTDEED